MRPIAGSNSDEMLLNIPIASPRGIAISREIAKPITTRSTLARVSVIRSPLVIRVRAASSVSSGLGRNTSLKRPEASSTSQTSNGSTSEIATSGNCNDGGISSRMRQNVDDRRPTVPGAAGRGGEEICVSTSTLMLIGLHSHDRYASRHCLAA
jgi:hypothetical protein